MAKRKPPAPSPVAEETPPDPFTAWDEAPRQIASKAWAAARAEIAKLPKKPTQVSGKRVLNAFLKGVAPLLPVDAKGRDEVAWVFYDLAGDLRIALGDAERLLQAAGWQQSVL